MVDTKTKTKTLVAVALVAISLLGAFFGIYYFSANSLSEFGRRIFSTNIGSRFFPAKPAGVCGDGVCKACEFGPCPAGTFENPTNCPADCGGGTAPSTCGDGKCDYCQYLGCDYQHKTEIPANCPSDCMPSSNRFIDLTNMIGSTGKPQLGKASDPLYVQKGPGGHKYKIILDKPYDTFSVSAGNQEVSPWVDIVIKKDNPNVGTAGDISQLNKMVEAGCGTVGTSPTNSKCYPLHHPDDSSWYLSRTHMLGVSCAQPGTYYIWIYYPQREGPFKYQFNKNAADYIIQIDKTADSSRIDCSQSTTPNPPPNPTPTPDGVPLLVANDVNMNYGRAKGVQSVSSGSQKYYKFVVPTTPCASVKIEYASFDWNLYNNVVVKKGSLPTEADVSLAGQCINAGGAISSVKINDSLWCSRTAPDGGGIKISNAGAGTYYVMIKNTNSSAAKLNGEAKFKIWYQANCNYIPRSCGDGVCQSDYFENSGNCPQDCH